MPSGPLHSCHIHPQSSHLLKHIPHILSLLACPSSSHSVCISIRLKMISYFYITVNVSMHPCFLLYGEHSGNTLISTKKGVNLVLTNIIYKRVNRSHTVWLFLHCNHADLPFCMFLSNLQYAGVTFFSLISRESISLHLTARGNRKKLHLHTCSCQSFALILRFLENTHIHCVAPIQRMFLDTHASTYSHT